MTFEHFLGQVSAHEILGPSLNNKRGRERERERERARERTETQRLTWHAAGGADTSILSQKSCE